jgi:hypothetical protein
MSDRCQKIKKEETLKRIRIQNGRCCHFPEKNLGAVFPGQNKKGVFPGTGRKEKEMNSARRKKLCVDEAIIPAENFNHNIEKLPKFWRNFTKKGRKKAGSRRNPLSF